MADRNLRAAYKNHLSAIEKLFGAKQLAIRIVHALENIDRDNEWALVKIKNK